MESEKLISNYTPNPRSKENDLENDFNYGNNVISASAEVRKGFLRKVYGILTVQLLMTCGVSGTIEIIVFDSKYLQWQFLAICISSEPTKVFLQNNPAIVHIASFSTLFVLFALMFKRQQFPVSCNSNCNIKCYVILSGEFLSSWLVYISRGTYYWQCCDLFRRKYIFDKIFLFIHNVAWKLLL